MTFLVIIKYQNLVTCLPRRQHCNLVPDAPMMPRNAIQVLSLLCFTDSDPVHTRFMSPNMLYYMKKKETDLLCNAVYI